ncbi:MAG: type II secretion system F family protein [Nocardioides sp.]
MTAVVVLNPATLASVALVPVALAVTGMLLLRERRRDLGFGTRLALDIEPAPRRLVRRLGRTALRIPGPAPDWLTQTTRRYWLNAGRSKGAVAGVVEANAGLAMIGLVATMALLVLGMPYLALVVAALGVAQPTLRLRMVARRRQHAIEVAAPGMLELIAVLVSAGLTFRHALDRVTERTRGPLGEEMRTLLIQIDFGWSPESALADLVNRCSAPTILRLAVVARQSIEIGAPISEALLALADDARMNFVVQLRVRAERLVVRGVAVLTLLSVLPFGVIIVCVLGVTVLERLGTF